MYAPFDKFIYDMCAEMTLMDQEEDLMRKDFSKYPDSLQPAMVTAFAITVKSGIPPETMSFVEAAFNAEIDAKKAARFFYELGVTENFRRKA